MAINRRRSLARLLGGLLAAALLAVLYDLWTGRVRVSGGSMTPTLLPGDELLASRLRLWLIPPRRGDIVVLAVRQPGAPDRLDIKRIAAAPGDAARLPDGERRMARGEYWALGDNGGASTDSRSYGPVPRSVIQAAAWWRTGPPGRSGRL
ncbi:MAG: signal peptidase I [Chloroflexi bacterium]|nr:signal peptidase I [Chloroflexota bacterium]